MELKYFKGLKKETTISKRYRELAKQYHPDKAINKDEMEQFTAIMQEINAEHKEVLVLLKYDALSRSKTEEKKIDFGNIAQPNFIKNVVSVFGLTDEQKQYFINTGRNMLTTFYDNIVENNLKKL